MISRHSTTSSGNDGIRTSGTLTPQPISTSARRFLWVFSIVMVLTAGTAFLIKLIEFLYQFSIADNTVAGGEGLRPDFLFAIAPLLSYLIVAAGFACLFLWAYLTGQFKNVEEPKYRMLRMQDQIDRAERHESTAVPGRKSS